MFTSNVEKNVPIFASTKNQLLFNKVECFKKVCIEMSTICHNLMQHDKLIVE